MGRNRHKLANSFKKVYREAALKEQDFECSYCYEPLTYRGTTADHIKPKSKGGLDRPENIAASCRPCNQLKGSMSESAYINKIKKFPHGQSIEWLIMWSNRRMNLATSRSVKRISDMFGVKP